MLDYKLLLEQNISKIKENMAKAALKAGRNPDDIMLDKADYITEMRCLRHPYDKGIKARKGIEF